MGIKLQGKNVTTILSVLFLISLFIASCLEYSSNKTDEKLNDVRGFLEAHNQQIDGFIEYDTGLNYLLGVRDVLISMNQSKDFNLDELINQRDEEFKQYRISLLRRLEKATHTPQMSIPIDQYNDAALLAYKQKLIRKNEISGEDAIKEITRLKKLKSLKDSLRNIFFFFGLFMQILSEIIRNEKQPKINQN